MGLAKIGLVFMIGIFMVVMYMVFIGNGGQKAEFSITPVESKKMNMKPRNADDPSYAQELRAYSSVTQELSEQLLVLKAEQAKKDKELKKTLEELKKAKLSPQNNANAEAKAEAKPKDKGFSVTPIAVNPAQTKKINELQKQLDAIAKEKEKLAEKNRKLKGQVASVENEMIAKKKEKEEGDKLEEKDIEALINEKIAEAEAKAEAEKKQNKKLETADEIAKAISIDTAKKPTPAKKDKKGFQVASALTKVLGDSSDYDNPNNPIANVIRPVLASAETPPQGNTEVVASEPVKLKPKRIKIKPYNYDYDPMQTNNQNTKKATSRTSSLYSSFINGG